MKVIPYGFEILFLYYLTWTKVQIRFSFGLRYSLINLSSTRYFLLSHKKNNQKHQKVIKQLYVDYE